MLIIGGDFVKCVLSYNKYKYGQKVEKCITDVFSVSMMPGTNKLTVIEDQDGRKINHTFDVNDTLKIELTAEDIT